MKEKNNKKNSKKNDNKKYVSKNKINTKEENKLIEKISTRRALIGFALIVPMFTIDWIDYLFRSISADTIMTLKKFFLSLLFLGIVLIYMSSKSHIEKEIEDRKLKQGNYKFKLKDQFYRYIPANFVHMAILILLINIGNFSKGIISEGKGLLGFLILSVSIIVFYTIWMIYCNEFSTKKGKIKYIIVLVLWILFNVMTIML